MLKRIINATLGGQIDEKRLRYDKEIEVMRALRKGQTELLWPSPG